MAGMQLDEQAIFEVARKIDSPEARAAYLQQICGDNAAIGKRVRDLLKAYEASASFLESPAIGQAGTIVAPASAAERPGTVIGPYKLLQQIGEGGMGVVWMAEQTQPVQRKVALKVIKPGMDSRQVVARFEAERQALAMMDHVNIARVFDGGATENGRPYFVMELVHGVPITKYCDDNRLTPRERLELFVPVCQAIQHAHQKGIIHRDIKPSNVMVTLYDGKPVPKVIDFGVAKATEQKLTERTLFTQYGTMIGTLEYMSPEQAEMSALGVDTRSDIYSLGVLLYELLTGSTPLTHKRMKEAAYAEILRMIKEEEPPRPSTRLSDSGEALASISAQRQMESAKLTKLVRGELDWIVMKTLEKDRNRRYETANAFAADVQRYLGGELVQACPPSAGYRLKKFARRNKGKLAAAAVLGLALLLAVSVIGWAVRDHAARQEEAQREQATRQVRVTGRVQLILDEIAQLERKQKWPEALDMARRASDLVAGGDAGTAVVARVQDRIDDLELVRLLDDIRASQSEWTENSFDYLGTAERFAAAFRDAGIDVAQLTSEEAAQRVQSRSAVMAALIPALDRWAGCRRATGDERGAESVWKVAGLVDPDPWRQTLRHAHGSKDVKALQTLADAPDLARQPADTVGFLGVALLSQGRADASVGVLSLAQRQHPADFWVHFDLAQAFARTDPPSLEPAAGCYRAALALRPRSSAAWNNLGSALKKQDKLDDASACYQRAIELDPRYFGAHHNLGLVLYKQGKLDDAIACWRTAIELHPKGPIFHCNLGHALWQQGKVDDAIPFFNKAIELEPKFALAHYNLGVALAGQNKLDDAIACYRRVIEIDPKFVKAYQRLAAILLGQKKDYDSAIEVIQKVISLQPDLAAPHFNLAVALKHKGMDKEAIASYRNAIRLQPTFAQACTSLAQLLTTCSDPQLRDPPEAVELARKAVGLTPQSAEAWQVLGWAQYRARDWQASIEALEKSIAQQVTPKGGNPGQWFFLAMAHWQLDHKEEARRWYDRAVAWTDRNQPGNEELRRVQAEATQLIGIEKKRD